MIVVQFLSRTVSIKTCAAQLTWYVAISVSDQGPIKLGALVITGSLKSVRVF